MIDLVPVYTRILMRYVSGALVSWGLLAPEEAQLLAMDPDLAIILGAGVGALVEGAYAWAKRQGGAT